MKRVLVPLDGSATSEAILPHLGRLFRLVDCEFHLARVTGDSAEEKKSAHVYLRALLDRIGSALAQPWPVVLVGTPAAAILGYALREKVDLIAMTTHGRSGLSRLLHGSVTSELLRTSRVPVFVVRPDTAASDLRRILVPLDGSGRSREALAPAVEMAKAAGGSLVLLTSVREGARRETALARLERAAEGLGVPAKFVVLSGDPASAILACEEAQMIVMATHGSGSVNRRAFGGVTEAVLKSTRVPMLVVRTEKPRVLETVRAVPADLQES